MPVDHHTSPAIARVPFGHQIAIPSSELCGISGTGRARRAPDLRVANCQGRIGNLRTCRLEGSRVNIASPDMQEIVIADIGRTGSHAFQARVGSKPVKAEQQALIPQNRRQGFSTGRGLKAAQKNQYRVLFL